MSHGRRYRPSTYTAPLPRNFRLTPAQAAFEAELEKYKDEALELGYKASDLQSTRQYHIVTVNVRWPMGIGHDGMTYRRDKLWDDHVEQLRLCLWKTLGIDLDRTGAKGR